MKGYLDDCIVIYDKNKTNGEYQVGSGRVMTVTHDSPFANDIVSQSNAESQEENIRKSLKDINA